MILWLNPFSGLSGDMLLGALLGLGASAQAVREAVGSTGIGGWRLAQTSVLRNGLAATQALVMVDDDQFERTADELLAVVRRARPEPVGELAGSAIAAIARVEAQLHDRPISEVRLHELGGLDTVVDVVGVAAAMYVLGVTSVHCGPLALGAGTVRTEHGVLPLPAPATAALLAQAGAPVVSAGVVGETVTPTGAALLLAAKARFGPVPAMAVRAVGYGAGSRDIEGRPNVLPALLGAPAGDSVGSDTERRTLIHIETNLDDVSGELLGQLLPRLLAEGAVDAWITPVIMKKGRPAHTVHVLSHPERAGACEQVLLRETGSLGLRRHLVERLALPRRIRTVHVEGWPIRVKYGPWGGKPEHDDVLTAADALGLTPREVAERVHSLGGFSGDDLDQG